MNESLSKKVYEPGYYGKKRLSASAWADIYARKWEKENADRKNEERESAPHFHICFSRQIGAGALEIADLLSEHTSFHVIDREILEYMAKDANITEKMIEFYDERYPGRISELFSMLISEKTFLKSDYARQLAETVTALAEIEPTIFVGRGTHLILPRESVLAVRLICSRENRVHRLKELMKIDAAEAERQLKVIDNEQQKFFQSVYQKKEAVKDEFDLIINRDHIKDASHIAQIVACAFERKFNQTF